MTDTMTAPATARADMTYAQLAKQANDVIARLFELTGDVINPVKHNTFKTKAALIAHLESLEARLPETDDRPADDATDDVADDVPDTVKLADLARQLGLNPKVARAKMRRIGNKIGMTNGKLYGRWVVPSKHLDYVTAALTK